MGRSSAVIEVCHRMFIVLYDYLYQDTVNNMYCFKPHYNTKGINLVSFLIPNQCILLICFYSFFNIFHFHVCGMTYIFAFFTCLCGYICTYMYMHAEGGSRLKSGIILDLLSPYLLSETGSFIQTQSSRNPSLPPCPPGISMGSGFPSFGFDTCMAFIHSLAIHSV